MKKPSMLHLKLMNPISVNRHNIVIARVFRLGYIMYIATSYHLHLNICTQALLCICE